MRFGADAKRTAAVTCGSIGGVVHRARPVWALGWLSSAGQLIWDPAAERVTHQAEALDARILKIPKFDLEHVM